MRTQVLLDAAAYVPAHKLNLTETPADFLDFRWGRPSSPVCMPRLALHYGCRGPSTACSTPLSAQASLPGPLLSPSLFPARRPPTRRSFYKLFGYPTGVGALVLRKENLPLLRKASQTWARIFMKLLHS